MSLKALSSYSDLNMTSEGKTELFHYHGFYPSEEKVKVQSAKTEIVQSFEHVEEQEFSMAVEEILEEEGKCNKESTKQSSLLRKTSVALAGGSMMVVGVPLVPLPGPGGIFAITGGLAVLATEFPAAKKILDKGTNKIRQFAEGSDDLEDSGFVVVDDEYDVESKVISTNTDADADADIYLDKVGLDSNAIQDTRSPEEKRKEFVKNTKSSVRRFTKGRILPIIEKISSHEKGNQESIVEDEPHMV